MRFDEFRDRLAELLQQASDLLSDWEPPIVFRENFERFVCLDCGDEEGRATYVEEGERPNFCPYCGRESVWCDVEVDSDE